MVAMEGQRVRKILFLVLFLGLFLLVARLFWPFLTIILWSSLIYGFLATPYDRVTRLRSGAERKVWIKKAFAGAFALGGVLLIAVPAIFLAVAVLRQLGDLISQILNAVERNPELLDLSPSSLLGGLVHSLSKGSIDLSSIDIKGELGRFLTERSGSIIAFSGAALRDAFSVLLTLAFMLFTLYFLFMDGKQLVKLIVKVLPIRNEYSVLFLQKLRDTGRQLLVGYFLVAIFQATAMFLICLAFGIKSSLVLACLTAIASFVPMIGTALVWLPTSAGIAISGNLIGGLLFLVLSALFVATLDNFVRPILLHERLKIHPLLIFFSILGGVSLLGFNGVVLGPLVLMLFFTAVDLYEEEAKD
jgi:predicted PurR-regulated permease PerM